MSDKYDFDAYKRAKLINNDLDNLVKAFNLIITSFTPYKKYRPVQDVIQSLQSNKTILEIHLNKTNKILETKGKIENG